MEKRKLSFWQIWNMSFGFLGIQMGFALQNSNVSRIFQTLGANIDDIPILWVAAPLTGLIIQPIIGYFSDKTWTKLGLRKPYFLAGAILASAAFLLQTIKKENLALQITPQKLKLHLQENKVFFDQVLSKFCLRNNQ